MKLIGDYHTHTIYSSYPKPSRKHAKGTIRENAEEAVNKGLDYLAITEHGPSHYMYGINKKLFKQIRQEIDSLNEEFKEKGLKILLGVEANIISVDGEIDVSDEIISDLDFLIMGYHYGAKPKTIKDGFALYIIQSLAKLGIGKNKARDYMTRAYINAIKKYPLDMISHPGSKAPVDIIKVAQYAEKYKVALEISSKHSELSIENLKKIKDMNIGFMLNSDAHKPADVGNVIVGLEKAKKSGLDLKKIKNIEI